MSEKMVKSNGNNKVNWSRFISLCHIKESRVDIISFVIKSLVEIHPDINKFRLKTKVIISETITRPSKCVNASSFYAGASSHASFETAMKISKESSNVSW